MMAGTLIAGWDQRASYRCSLPLKSPFPQSTHEKNLRQTPTEQHRATFSQMLDQHCSRSSKAGQGYGTGTSTAERTLQRLEDTQHVEVGPGTETKEI